MQKVKVKGHNRGAPEMPRRPVARPPFKKGKGGYFAHGTVKETREHEDGKSMHVTVRHGKLKSGHDGLFSSYDRESRLHLPMDAAKHFPMGQGVTLHLKKRGAGKGPGLGANATGDGNNDSDADDMGA